MKQTILRSLLVGAACLSLVACGKNSKKPNIEITDDMMNQPAIKAQGAISYDADTSGMLVPPEGTVPQGYKPYRHTSPVQAEQEISNPFPGDFSPEMMDLGRVHYQRYCLVCHGEMGDGKGPVHEPFNGLIKTLVQGPVVGFSDVRLYHIITAGQGIMGAYGSQIPDEKARWAVVNYVRSLQKQAQ